MQWTRIVDLPANLEGLVSAELASLAPIWSEQSARLSKTEVLKEFNERLKREWAIETGIIEGIYLIDRGITQLLVERGLEASLIPHGTTDHPPEEVISILKDQEGVLDGIFDFISQRRPLSVSYIKEMHHAFTRNQHSVLAANGAGRRLEVPLLRGEWKHQPNNPTRPDGTVHEYCPPEHVASEMDRMIEMHLDHEAKGISPEVESAWLHHRFTQIHPFQDGNGRVARALASLIFLRAGWFTLVIHRDDRSSYIDALELADEGNLSELTDLFTSVQKQSFLRALAISEDVLRDHQPIQQVIQAAKERLKARFDKESRKQKAVFLTSERLEKLTTEKLNETAKEIDKELRYISPEYSAYSDVSNEETWFWFKKQIIDVARQSNYFADMRTYEHWARLKIIEERQAELIVSFHSLGVDFLGILAASAFLEFRDRSENGETTIEGPYPLSKDVFQFAFNEDADVVEARYSDWLSRVLLSGLDQWRRQI